MTRRTRQILFGVYALVLLGFLGSMIWRQQTIRQEGSLYKFKCIPYDPIDPFRGAYIELNFESLDRSIEDDPDFDQYRYAIISEDENGFANVSGLSIEFSDEEVLVPLYMGNITESYARYDLPFTRYYMTSEKAIAAEDLLRDVLGDSTKVVYAAVFIEASDYSLKGVYINDQRIEDYLH